MILSDVDNAYNKDIGCCKGAGYPAESKEHYLTKSDICKNLLDQKIDFITEVRFKNGMGRCDVLDIDNGIAYEVVKSEKEESIFKKRFKYPVDLVVVMAKKVIE